MRYLLQPPQAGDTRYTERQRADRYRNTRLHVYQQDKPLAAPHPDEGQGHIELQTRRAAHILFRYQQKSDTGLRPYERGLTGAAGREAF